MSTHTHGQLQVWWIPQIPMKSFIVDVPDLATAKLFIETLGNYDLFQYENHIKPDYSNAGGLRVWDDAIDADEHGEKWTDWESCDGESIDDVTLEECRSLDAVGARL